MKNLTGYLLYEPADAAKNNGFIELFQEESRKLNIQLSLLLTTSLSQHDFTTEKPDFIINRSRIPSLAEYLECCKIRLFNSAKVCKICNDKQSTYDYLQSYCIPYMDCCSFSPELCVADYLTKAQIFGYPFVLKPADGHGGMHVSLVSTSQELCQKLDKIRNERGILPKMIFQRCASDIGKDLRVYVLGNKIVAGMMRTRAHTDSSEIRANFSLGGLACVHTLTQEEMELTNRIISALPADLIGIDFIYDHSKPVFNEIEDVVGTRMLYAYTDINIVRDYLHYILAVLS